MKKFIPFVFLILVGIIGCKKEIPLPPNPYDGIDYSDETPSDDTLNAVSLPGLHRDLFIPRCAVPGCHDGTFEPDFRTVQSAYSTLVYAPVIKNNEQNTFTFRVVPNDTAMSVLYERITNCCFVNTDDRMPQDNIGTGLAQTDINKVAQWIMTGAKSSIGEQGVRPDLEPNFPYYFAANSTFTVEYSAANNRVDSVIYNPFLLPAGTTDFQFVAIVTDDITPVSEMQYNKLYISSDMNDFSGATQFSATFFQIPGEAPVWVVNVPTSGLTPGQPYYMRYYTNDGNHPQNTEFPTNESVEPYKTYWSFILQP